MLVVEMSCLESLSEFDHRVIVVGATRSGTTLLRLMLGHHPSIADLGEAEWIFRRPDLEAQSGREWEAYVRREETYGSFRLDPESPLDGPSQALLHRMRSAEGRKPIASFTFHDHYCEVVRRFPHAHYVHLTRDPRDVVASWLRLGWVGHAASGGRWWARLQRQWVEARSALPKERVREISFEDLVTSPGSVLRSTCEGLGLAFDTEMLRYPERTTYAAPDPGEAGKWRRGPDPRLVRRCERGAGAELERWGYARTSVEAPGWPPDPARTALEETISRLVLQQNKIRKFGVGVWAAELVGRRLGLDPLHAWAANRIYWRERRQRK